MTRRLLVPDDAKSYRWLLNLDSPFAPPPLSRGFEYELQIDRILEMIWSPRMTDIIGIDLDRFREVTKVSIAQQKRDLLDVALTFGATPSSRAFFAATDELLLAENSGHHSVGIRPPALRSLPVRLEADGSIEIWCGSAANVRSDIALIHADIDLSFKRVQPSREASIRAHSAAGPRLVTDCDQLKRFFEADFLPGSVAITRGYFSGCRYLVHAIPPRTDDGFWKHSLIALDRCYGGFWEFCGRLKPTRIAVQFISLGMTGSLEKRACEILVEQAIKIRSSQRNPPTVCLVAPSTAVAKMLVSVVQRYRLDEPLGLEGGFRPAGNPCERFSPDSLAVKKAAGATDSAEANRSSVPTVGFSRPRSSRLT